MMRANTAAFLRIVRAGHPAVPIVVASPLIRPDAEAAPNALGATLDDLRHAMEEAVQSLSDELVTLVPDESSRRNRWPTAFIPGALVTASLPGSWATAVANADARSRTGR